MPSHAKQAFHVEHNKNDARQANGVFTRHFHFLPFPLLPEAGVRGLETNCAS